MSFSEKESLCATRFSSAGQFWHFTNDGTRMEAAFATIEEMKTVMNSIAICSIDADVEIITFEVMSDHIHFLLEGELSDCYAFVNRLKHRLMNLCSRTGRTVDWRPLVFDIPIRIQDLRMLRNEIVYINRNGFLADSSATPFSYTWGAGYLYFNALSSIVHGVPCSEMTFRQKRRLFRTDKMDFPPSFYVYDGVIIPSSYCNVAYGQSFFRDGSHYFNLLSKAFEAYSECAKRLGDNVFLTDEEVYPAVTEICRKQYSSQSPRNLGINQKMDLARVMHREYNSTNEQIRRILSLDISIVNEMFPSGVPTR